MGYGNFRRVGALRSVLRGLEFAWHESAWAPHPLWHFPKAAWRWIGEFLRNREEIPPWTES